jgi:hypothetical protein
VHEPDEPNAVAHLFDVVLLFGKDSSFRVRCMRSTMPELSEFDEPINGTPGRIGAQAHPESVVDRCREGTPAME